MCLVVIINTLHGSEEGQSVAKEPIHTVYSHAWYEDTLRKKCEIGGNIVSISDGILPVSSNADGKVSQPDTSTNVMTFYKKRIAKTRSGKSFLVGDDDTTFYNTHAMKFAFLGDSMSMPVYPDESLKTVQSLRKAVLYTQPAVCSLADHLYDRVVTEKIPRIALIGHCGGASIAINCMKKLASFSDCQDYFKDTQIKTLEQAKAIIEAVNKGCFIAMVPLMNVEHHNAIAMPSALLTIGTMTALATVAYYQGSDMVSSDTNIAQLGAVGLGLLAHCTLGRYAKYAYAKIIRHAILPLLTCGHYDSFHEDPIDDIAVLQDALTGPVALQFTNNDWVMNWKNEDLLALWGSFARENAHLVITSDKGHMEISPEFLKFLSTTFLPEDIKKSEVFRVAHTVRGVLNSTLPTSSELKNKIYPWGFVSKIWMNNKWAIGCAVLCALPILLRMMQAGSLLHSY